MPEKQIITTANAPQAIGPYSIGVRVGDTLFIAGQLGIDAQTGEVVSGGIEAETRQALTNMKAILEAAGARCRRAARRSARRKRA